MGDNVTSTYSLILTATNFLKACDTHYFVTHTNYVRKMDVLFFKVFLFNSQLKRPGIFGRSSGRRGNSNAYWGGLGKRAGSEITAP